MQALTDLKDDVAKIWNPLPEIVGDFLEWIHNITQDVPAALVISATTLVVRFYLGHRMTHHRTFMMTVYCFRKVCRSIQQSLQCCEWRKR